MRERIWEQVWLPRSEMVQEYLWMKKFVAERK